METNKTAEQFVEKLAFKINMLLDPNQAYTGDDLLCDFTKVLIQQLYPLQKENEELKQMLETAEKKRVSDLIKAIEWAEQADLDYPFDFKWRELNDFLTNKTE